MVGRDGDAQGEGSCRREETMRAPLAGAPPERHPERRASRDRYASMRYLIPATLLVALAACSSPDAPANDATMTGTGEYDGVKNAAVEPVTLPAPAANTVTPAPAATAKLEADYLGKWIGVEGMVLDVKKRAGGGVTLDMVWGLDPGDKGTFPGSVTAEGLRFTRNGKDEILVPSDGDATGLKWLAGKKDCLTVKTGEGYCRA
jgi:hypothetical protein